MPAITPATPPPPVSLTDDERKVAQALVCGTSANTTAARLGMDITAYRGHERALAVRFGVEGRLPLVHALCCHRPQPPAGDARLPSLDASELLLLRALVSYPAQEDIAAAALITLTEVRPRRSRLVRVTGADNTADLVRRAHAWGMLGPHPSYAPARSPAGLHTAPACPDLLVWAESEMRGVINRCWPHRRVRVGAVIPSLTSIVRTVHVDGQVLVAKYQPLGAPLHSLTRGTYGSAANIRRQQVAYRLSDNSNERVQHRHLTSLRTAGLSVAAPTQAVGGFLFTEHVPGPTLSHVLKDDPAHAATVLTRVLRSTGPTLHDTLLDRNTLCASPIIKGLRGLQPDTASAHHLAHSAATQPAPHLITQITHAARTLLPRIEKLPRSPRPLYGNLHTDHIICHDADRETLLSPLLHFGPRGADLAQLISRCTLDLLACPTATAKLITDALRKAVTDHSRAIPRPARASWLLDVLCLWHADTLNAVAAALLAPPGMRLPHQAHSILQHLSRVSALLTALRRATSTRDPQPAWLYMLNHLARGHPA
ncbi:hypothetical protein [Streptomyces aureocirculatus]|uniref:hypothetical protein n=1 Tax=Streptomyces aureocirculatus TaxID=67275 RepID=UPI00068E582F|nr:hypothetical protein [Streptomyces aureocirculatus]